MRADPRPLLLYCPACRAGRRGTREGVWRYYQVLENPGKTSWHAGGIPLVGVGEKGLGVPRISRFLEETVGRTDESRVACERRLYNFELEFSDGKVDAYLNHDTWLRYAPNNDNASLSDTAQAGMWLVVKNS